VTPYERQVLTLWRRGLSLGQIAVATGRPCSGWYVTGLERREARRERQALRELAQLLGCEPTQGAILAAVRDLVAALDDDLDHRITLLGHLACAAQLLAERQGDPTDTVEVEL
jgi:CRP-like cAMP-binding protein